jgi:microcystin-dependent protein
VDPFIGEIRLVPYNFAPRGWADCNGQTLPIAQYTALFSLLGTTYGGNGQTTFQLPNLQGRVAVHTDTSNHVLGEQAGSETVTLTVAQIPAHNHAFNAAARDEDTNTVTNNFLSNGNSYGLPPSTTTMNAGSIGPTGGGQPHENMQPYLVLRYIIALEGIYPSRS